MLHFIQTILLVFNKISNAVKANVSFNQFEYYAVSISHTCSEAVENTQHKAMDVRRVYAFKTSATV